MYPSHIFYEPSTLDYPLGKMLKTKYGGIEWTPVKSHNNIPELRAQPNSSFALMKKFLIIGVRKTHKYIPNHKISDFLVPYTSSGCGAMCLYCYLVCNYNKCSYLRLFVNREQMLDKLKAEAMKSEKEMTFEIGSNSDLVFENVITGNLPWTIENFSKQERGYITFPTKFDMVEPLLPLEHRGRVIVRMSVNPQEIIKTTELGTSPLKDRIKAVNLLSDAGYRIGILIAPVIMVENWKALYKDLLDALETELSARAKKQMTVEVIFMTYSFVHRAINREAFPNAVNLYDKDKMTGRGRGKYCYTQELKADGERFLRDEIETRFGRSKIVYVV